MINLEEVNHALRVLQEAYEEYTDRKVAPEQVTNDHQIEGLMWKLNSMFKVTRE